jgi:hypothetical protein
MTENEEEGHKVWYSYIPKCVENMTWEDEPIEIVISIRPQKQWKPSEEQMENLSRACNGGTYRTSLLMELYQQLKKLREE